MIVFMPKMHKKVWQRD